MELVQRLVISSRFRDCVVHTSDQAINRIAESMHLRVEAAVRRNRRRLVTSVLL
jgi:hypothetical protein